MIKITTVAYAGKTNTLGLDCIKHALKKGLKDKVEIKEADYSTVKHCDYLLVSLYWWRDFYEHIKFLKEMGIDPKKKDPIIIIGGMSALNPRTIINYFHYCVLGDGENIICDLILGLENKQNVYDIKGIWHPENECEVSSEKILQPLIHTSKERTDSRIEIARGCKSKCPFCELAFVKPYRKLPIETAISLIKKSKTKTMALFAPDRAAYPGIEQLEEAMVKYNKRGTGSDARLDILLKLKKIDNARFGVEGFSERTRKKIHKIPTNEMLLKGLNHVAHDMTNSRNSIIESAVMYMIGDLPGESIEDIKELWSVLNDFDKNLKRKFTLFFSVSSFSPAQFTPMQKCQINPYTEFMKKIKETKPYYKYLIIAFRGSVIAAPQRLLQALTIRGDESCCLAMYYFATKGRNLLRSTKNSDGKIVEGVLKKVGFNPEKLYNYMDWDMPWSNIKQPIGFKEEWK